MSPPMLPMTPRGFSKTSTIIKDQTFDNPMSPPVLPDKGAKPMVIPDLASGSASSSATTSRCWYRNSSSRPPDGLVFDKDDKPMVIPDLASGSASSSATTSKVFGGATVP